MEKNRREFYRVTAQNAAGDYLFIGEASTDAYDYARVPVDVKDGGGMPVLISFLLSKRSAPRYDFKRGRMVRNRVKFFRVHVPYTQSRVWKFQREADGSLTDISSEARGPVPVADHERPEITVTGPERASTPDRPGTPLVIVRKGYDTAAETVEAPARVVAAEAPARATVTAPVSTGTERVTATTAERLTVSADNPTGEPVYVKTLPERHPVHPGKAVREVFGHDGPCAKLWKSWPGAV